MLSELKTLTKLAMILQENSDPGIRIFIACFPCQVCVKIEEQFPSPGLYFLFIHSIQKGCLGCYASDLLHVIPLLNWLPP